MSEDRRKRQQERAGASTGTWKKLLIYGGIVALFVAAYFAGWYHKKLVLRRAAEDHKYDTFAQCLAAKQVKMYGLYYCPHCRDQKEMFGASFQFVPYQECAIKGTKDLAVPCKIAGAKLFPSWQFGTEPLKEGVLSLEALSDKTGCRLP